MTTYLGIDVGTTSIKGALVREDGMIALMSHYVYLRRSTHRDDAYIECSEIVVGLKQVLRVLLESRESGTTAAMAVSVLGEAVCAIGPDGRILADKLLLPMDYRGESRYRRFVTHFGPERLQEMTGHSVHPMFTLSKVLWYLDQERDPKSTHFLDTLSFVNWVLTGTAVTDHSIAARTQLYDVTERRWSAAVLQAASVDPEQLPNVDASGAFVGYLRRQDLGLEIGADLPVFLGGFDQACAAVGSGISSSSSAIDNIGTTICIGRFTPQHKNGIEMQTMGYQWTPALLSEGFFVNGGSLSGGIVLDWCTGLLAKSEPGAEEVEWWLERCKPGPSDLLFLPYLTGAGAPRPDPSATAQLAGMTASSTPVDIFGAALDSVCFESRLGVEALEDQLLGGRSDCIVVSGSPTRSLIWLQRKADVYGRTIRTMEVTESSVYGAAMIGASASQSSVPAAELSAHWCHVANQIDPGPHAQSFDDKFSAYLHARSSANL